MQGFGINSIWNSQQEVLDSDSETGTGLCIAMICRNAVPIERADTKEAALGGV